MKAHTYYIIFGRPPIGGKLPPWRRHWSYIPASICMQQARFLAKITGGASSSLLLSSSLSLPLLHSFSCSPLPLEVAPLTYTARRSGGALYAPQTPWLGWSLVEIEFCVF